MAMQPAVFLDLDNTIIDGTGTSPDEAATTLIQGAAPAIASMRGLGYRIVVAANHENIARGKVTEDEVHVLHRRVAELVQQTANGAVIDAFYYCPFHPRGNLKQYKKDHATRKPKPGMLLQAAEELGLDLSISWMIGDELADVQAGHAAGARTILLRPDAERLMPTDPATLEGVTSETPDRDRPTGPDFFAVSLVDAARLIAQQPRVEPPDTKSPRKGRKWDAEKIAKIQVPRPPKAEGVPSPPAGQPAAVREFRPWGAPTKEDDAPIVTKPFRKKLQDEEDVPDSPPIATETAQADTRDASAAAAASTPIAAPEIPKTIQNAIEKKKQQAEQPESSQEKTLRLILHELRAQRGSDQEFSFLTLIALALQLVAIVCLLGGLFMGWESDGVFLRWVGTGIMAQLTAIAVILYGR
jgi:histidinol-phosphate phosphatase family protein